MIRIVAVGQVSDIESRTLEQSGKKVTNFRIAADGLNLRASAWGDLGGSVTEGRAIIEGKMSGRAYQVDGKDRVSQDITISSFELLSGAGDEDFLGD